MPSGQKHVQSLSKKAPFLHEFTLGQCSSFIVKNSKKLSLINMNTGKKTKLTSTFESRVGQLDIKKTKRGSLAH